MKIGIFLSEEGFGHASRQIAICESLLALRSDLSLVFFADRRIKFLSSRINNFRVEFRKFSNPYYLVKDKLNALDIYKTYHHFLSSLHHRDYLIHSIIKISSDIDIFISDGVPIVSQISSFYKKKSFSIQHFSWHWLLSTIHSRYFSLNNNDYYSISLKMLEDYQRFTRGIKLPLSFSDDLALLQSNCFSCSDLIISPDLLNDNSLNHRKNFILLMDNGTNSLKFTLESLSSQIATSRHSFALRSSLMKPEIQRHYSKLKNVQSISSTREMHRLIPKVSGLIARGGFNTISESLFASTPCALINENNNPEISANLDLIRKNKLGLVFEPQDLRNNFMDVINQLLSDELRLSAFRNHLTFRYDGANIISKFILKSSNV